MRASDEDGRQYNIELQKQNQNFYDQRAIYYLSQVYGSALKKGLDYGKLQPAIGIHFLSFEMFQDNLDYHSWAQLFRQDSSGRISHKVFSDQLTLHFIEMSKCVKIEDELELWIYILNHAHQLSEDQVKDIVKDNPEFTETFKTLERASRDPEVITVAEMLEKAEHDEATRRLMEKESKEEIESGKKEIESGKKEIEFGKLELESRKKEIEVGRKELESGMVELESERLELKNKRQEIEMKKQEIETKKQEVKEEGYRDGVRQTVLSLSQNSIDAEKISCLLGISLKEVQAFLNAGSKT